MEEGDENNNITQSYERYVEECRMLGKKPLLEIEWIDVVVISGYVLH